MRKSTRFLSMVFIAIFILTLSSCKKDDEIDENKPNQIEFNGKTYELSSGLIYIGDLDNGERESTICLYSSGVSLDSEGRLQGRGEVFWFEDICHTSENIQGTYNAYDWLNTDQELEPGLIDEVEFGVDWYRDIPETEREWHEFYNGTANITVDGSTYKITFTGKDEENIAVSLYYKGSLIKVE